MQQELLLGDLTRQGLLIYPSRNALIWRDQELTYLGLNSSIDTLAAGLRQLGVRRGDRVALYLHNLPQFVQTFYALARLGAIAVPINLHWKGRDLHYLLSTVEVSGVITITPLWSRLKEIRPALPNLKWAVVINASDPQPLDTISWEQVTSDLLSDPVNVRNLEGLDPVVIAYTAGMGGSPKPAMLSHFNLLANCEQIEDMEQIQLDPATKKDPRTGLESASNPFEVALLPLPLYDLFSLNIGLNLTIKLGGTAVLMERFEPETALKLIEEHKCTLLFGSPRIFAELVSSPRLAAGNVDLSSLKYAFSYGAPLPGRLSQAFYERTGKPLFAAYGAVEASPIIACTAAGPQSVPDSVGYPLGVMQVMVVDRQGNNLVSGQTGQLVAQGPNVALGYYDPSNPRQPLPVGEDGWFNTGDMAQTGTDGSFYLVDRKQDVLSVQGRSVFPRQIEQILLSNPGVKEAAALAVEDTYGGHHMVAFIIPASQPPSVTEAQLLLHCRQKLPAPVCPQRIYVYEDAPELPRLPDGRIWRRPLRAIASEKLE